MRTPRSVRLKEIKKHRELYIFILPALTALIIFSYVPMYGVLMAFQDVKIGHAFTLGNWVGLKHFTRFFNSGWFTITIRNTILLSLVNNFLCWPFPIVLALLMHNCINNSVRKVAQSATYIPYLLSVVVVISILNVFCSGESGIVNILIRRMGGERINFFGDPNWVIPLYVISELWVNMGYSAIIYLAALSGVDGSLIEASMIDGAGKFKQIWNIQLPTIAPTVITMFILNMGRLFSIGPDKMLLMQTPLNLGTSEIIATYVYKTGFAGAQYGFSTAVGLIQSVINMILLLVVNHVARKRSETTII